MNTMGSSAPARLRSAGVRPVLRRLARALMAGVLLPALLSGCMTSADDLLVVEGGNPTPRLQNNEAARSGPVVRAGKLNAVGAARNATTFAAFVGPLRVDYAPDTQEIATDIDEIQSASRDRNFDPSAELTIDFRDATLDYVLTQLLGGALAVNYIAPDNLGGKVNFRTEKPIPKSRILGVVRDILARNNLVMRYINGVYHIGTRETIETLQANAAAGAQGEDAKRIVKLAKGNAAEVVSLVSRMVPPSVQLLTTSSPNTVIIQANEAEAASTERLLRTLSNMSTGEKTVAILPLTQSEPREVAQRLADFYAATVRGDETPVTVLPLEAQRALLVGTPDRQLMVSVQLLVRQLDRSVADVSSLRVIPLTHIKAIEIAPQLAQSFGSGTGGQLIQTAAAAPRRGVAQRQSRSRLFPRVPNANGSVDTDNEDGSGLAIPGPAGVFQPGSVAGPRPDAASLQGNGTGEAGAGEAGEAAPAAASVGGAAGGAVAAPAEGEVRIIPDTRNNTILVYSSYRTYSRMRDVVAALDVPQSQAVIEATVLEVELNDNLSQGVAFFLRNSGFAIGSGAPGTLASQEGGIIGFDGNFGNFSVTAVLRALQEVTGVKIVSSPYLTVINGQSARLVIGDQIPFATASQSSNNLGNVTVTREIEILDTGVVMEITPMIHADNSVDLKINQSVSAPIASTGGDDLTPTISTRDIQSQILVQSGRTVLLGGLIQDRLANQATKVPKLGDVPVLGNLFKQKAQQARRTELVVLITPRVSRTSTELELITRQLESSLVGAQTARGAEPAVIKP